MWYKDETEFKTVNGYEIGGIWYPRVTRILEIKAKPALEQFMKEMENYSSAEDVKNKSATEGSLVHETVEKLVTGESVEIPEEIAPAVIAFQAFNEKRNIVFHPEFVECKVWSLRHRYAGTVDAIATVDGKFGVLDIKTSSGFYPEYNLQTAAYMGALQEFAVKKTLALPREIETRWILRINQHRVCTQCSATLREKGGRIKIRNGKQREIAPCAEETHSWGELQGDVDLKEFPFLYKDMKAFVAAKLLWEWENDYWLRKIGYMSA
ncbi:MAG: Uncharacterized protein G01um101433_369 [Parcubacteria group bacterium Gr01-1014_33]|nr:MAG: Uncharacterized protein G01um101433_369 [Parcubacteria group bacterium Gr01-1014_33]